MMDLARSKTVRWLGFLLSLVALGVFVKILAEHLSNAEIAAFLDGGWGSLGASLAFYLVAFLPLTAGTVLIARACGAAPGPLVLARILLLSQLGKYLPGNVGQFLGRAYLGLRQGIPLNVTAGILVLELSGLIAASAVLCLIAVGGGLVQGDLFQLGGVAFSKWHAVALAGFLGGLAIVVILTRSKLERLRRIASALAKASVFFALALILVSFCNVVILERLTPAAQPLQAAMIVAAVVVSWFAGFVVPGAPAGVGVRELAFIGMLEGLVSVEALVLTAALVRLTTVLGDLLAFLAGYALRTWVKEPAAEALPER